MAWNVDAALKLRGAIELKSTRLKGCKVDILYKGAPPHYPGCWVVASLSHDIFTAIVKRYVAEDGETPLEQLVQEKLLELVGLVEDDAAPVN